LLAQKFSKDQFCCTHPGLAPGATRFSISLIITKIAAGKSGVTHSLGRILSFKKPLTVEGGKNSKKRSIKSASYMAIDDETNFFGTLNCLVIA